eukprot:m.112777 g.112777  ORF g.112777 m.112777 type:complete len:244 (+) comp17040_c0_seq1:130-861(+)
MNSFFVATVIALGAHIGVTFGDAQVIPGRCAGQCGSWEVQWDHDTGKPCACDDLCQKRNDCCSDFFDACGTDMSKYSAEYADEDLDRVVIDGEQEVWSDEYSEDESRFKRSAPGLTNEESAQRDNDPLETNNDGTSMSLSKLDRVDENEFEQSVDESTGLETETEGVSKPSPEDHSNALIPRSIAVPMLVSFIIIVAIIGAVSVTKRIIKSRRARVDTGFMVLPTTHSNSDLHAFTTTEETAA